MEDYKERGRKSTFSGTGCHRTCEWRKIKESNKRGHCFQ